MRFIVPVLVGLLAANCAPRIEPVEVEFSNLRIDGFERAELELTVFNPNRVTVDVEALRYSLRLGRDTVALGERTGRLRVAAQDTVRAEFPFTIRFEFDHVFNRVGSLLDDTLELTISGRYSLPGLFGPKRRPFRYQDVIPLRPEVEKYLGPFRRLFDRSKDPEPQR